MEILVIWLLCGFIGLAIAQKKGINMAIGFLAGAILGPLVFLMLFVKGSGVAAADSRKCPACAEMVKLDAKICKHCKTPLEPPADYKTCTQCGNLISKAAVVCPHCRKQVTA